MRLNYLVNRNLLIMFMIMYCKLYFNWNDWF
uniref:Uncharacterized protein n=1 Tax=Anguilla anguilla TaxID=7936 RepID=A0A0E9TYG5_ANGAN